MNGLVVVIAFFVLLFVWAFIYDRRQRGRTIDSPGAEAEQQSRGKDWSPGAGGGGSVGGV